MARKIKKIFTKKKMIVLLIIVFIDFFTNKQPKFLGEKVEIGNV